MSEFVCTDYGRSLVVIDPEDDDQCRRLAHLVSREIDEIPIEHTDVAFETEMTMAGRRALAALVVPPKPDEPTGMFAQILDAEGLRWVRLHGGSWQCENGTQAGGYALVDAVEVLP